MIDCDNKILAIQNWLGDVISKFGVLVFSNPEHERGKFIFFRYGL